MATANVKAGQLPNSAIPDKVIAVSPAAGPLTANCAGLTTPTKIPPITPAINPDNKGAPDAWAIPKHKGIATKNTAIPAGKSLCQYSPVNKYFPNL
jgi:hypothetical protein